MNYTDLIASFATRTLSNLDLVKHTASTGDPRAFEITQLWYSLLGLTVAPRERETVVDDVRTDVDRWRTGLLVAIAESFIARNRPGLAAPYLEHVVSQHPDNEPATRKLIAAYLESGELARAAALDPAPAKPADTAKPADDGKTTGLDNGRRNVRQRTPKA
jgi:hypothetical protein